jgi:hypothetical protein
MLRKVIAETIDLYDEVHPSLPDAKIPKSADGACLSLINRHHPTPITQHPSPNLRGVDGIGEAAVALVMGQVGVG